MKIYKIMMTLLDILAENHPGKQKSRSRQNSDRTTKEPQETLGAHSKRKLNLLLAMWSSLYSLKAEILTIGLWVGKILFLQGGWFWELITHGGLTCFTFTSWLLSAASFVPQNRIPVRGNPHILVVGDPGLGKSQVNSFVKHSFLCIVIGNGCVMDLLLNACFFL